MISSCVYCIFTLEFLLGAKTHSKAARHATFSCVYCILAPQSFLLGAHWALLGVPFRDVGGTVELLGRPLGLKWSQKHQDEGHKSDFGSSGGGQGVSEALNGSIWGRCSSFVLCYLVVWYVFCKNGFVHHGCSVALQLLFSMCWTWSRQRRRRGRRPHDVHVRCLEVHGTIHMMVAKSQQHGAT